MLRPSLSFLLLSLAIFCHRWYPVSGIDRIDESEQLSQDVDRISRESSSGFAPLPKNPLIPFQTGFIGDSGEEDDASLLPNRLKGKLKRIKSIWTGPTLSQLSYLRQMSINPNPRALTTAVVRMRGDSSVSGEIILEQMRNGPVLISGKLTGFPRDGKFGFHFHEFPILAEDCESAGEHYNPYMVRHGGQEDTLRHLGDLGNLIVQYHGNAHIVITDRRISLSGPHSVLGRSLVVHENEDDLGTKPNRESQTTGNSGGRLACGTIELVPDSKG